MKKAFWAIVLALGSAACGGSAQVDDGSVPAVEAEPSVTTQGLTLVYTHRADGRELKFYVAENGSCGTMETVSIDEAPKPRPTMGKGIDSLAKLFEAAAPDHAVPPELVAADEFASDLREQAKVIEGDAKALRNTASDQPSPAASEYEAPPPQQVRSGTCSTDWNGDNWAAQWFSDNYCNAFGTSFPAQNQNWFNRDNSATATSGGNPDGQPTEIFGAVLNANFTAGGTYRGQYNDGTWHTLFTGSLPARDVWWVNWFGLKWNVRTQNDCNDCNHACMAWYF